MIGPTFPKLTWEEEIEKLSKVSPVIRDTTGKICGRRLSNNDLRSGRECEFCLYAIDRFHRPIKDIDEGVKAYYCPFKQCPIPTNLYPVRNQKAIKNYEAAQCGGLSSQSPKWASILRIINTCGADLKPPNKKK